VNEWNNIPDDELDAILKKSAENFTPGFDESAWKDMSEKLDRGVEPANSGKPYAKWVKWPIMGLVALLFVSGIYWVSKKRSVPAQSAENIKLKNEQSTSKKSIDSPPVTNNESEVKIQSEVKTESERISGPENVAAGDKSDVSEQKSSRISTSEIKSISEKRTGTDLTAENRPTIKTDAKETGNESKVGRTVLLAKQNKRQRDVPLAVNRKTGSLNGSIEDNNIQRGTSPVKPGKSRAIVSEPVTVLNASAAFSSERAEDALENPEQLTKRWGSITPLKTLRFKHTAVESVLPAIKDRDNNLRIVEPVKITKTERGFGFRVIYSPDFSTIGSNKIFKIGNNIGLVGEYRFNSRWSVQAGAIKSLKYYEATPDQYKWPYFLVKPGNPLKVISATCNMLDIPVNVRYDFFSRPQQKWFASAGFTNYLMLKEKYKYTYEIDDDPAIKSRAWEGKTGFYPFGVLNLSGGYERRVTRKLSIQGEPFFKIPLGEVGYGKVKLITIGVFISGKIEI
jgi:hypothetical protein